jgi:hypothetical protein
MHRRREPPSGWTTVAGAAWLLLGAYLGVSPYLIGRYQPKIVLDREGATALQNRGDTLGERLYEVLASIWQYNRFVIPALGVFAIALSVIAWSRWRGSRGVAA